MSGPSLRWPRLDFGFASRAAGGIYTFAASSLVTAVLLPVVALLRRDFQRILLAVVFLEMLFVIDINFGIREEHAQFGAIEGFNVSLTTLAIAALYTAWLIGFLAREGSSVRRVRMNGPLALYLAFVGLSITQAYDVELAQFQLFMLVQMFLIHVYIASALRTRRDILFASALLAAGVIFEALLVLFAVALGRSSIDIGITASGVEQGRALGSFGSPISTASYFALLLAPCAGLVVARISGRLTALAMLAFVLGTIALIFTQSRGAWISFVLSMTILILVAWWRGRISLRVPLCVAALVTLLLLPFAGLIIQRIASDDGGSARSRIPLAIIASRIIEDHPWFGIGPNNFAPVGQRYVTSEFAGEWIYVVHNKYLLVWAETGLFSLLAFVLFLVTSLRQGWRVWRFGDRILAPLALGFTAAIVGHLEHMFFDIFHSRIQVQTLWLISGLIVAMRHVRGDV